MNDRPWIMRTYAGHSSARDAGWEIIYSGTHCTPDEIAAAALEEDVDLIGLSALSGSHMGLVPVILEKVDIPVIFGRVISKKHAISLLEQIFSAVDTPADHDRSGIADQTADIVAAASQAGA